MKTLIPNDPLTRLTRRQPHWLALCAMLVLGGFFTASAQAQKARSDSPKAQSTSQSAPLKNTAKHDAPSTAKARTALRALSRDLNALQADFTQYQQGPDGARRDVNTGTVALMAPNKFRWHYEKPQEQLIIATGEEILIFDPDLEQLTIKKQDNESNPIYVLFNPALIDTHYRLSDTRRAEGLLWVKIVPRQPDENAQEVWLGINEKTGQLVQIHLLDKLNQVVVFEFSHIRRNPELKPELFRFSPPAGTDVVRDEPVGGEF